MRLLLRSANDGQGIQLRDKHCANIVLLLAALVDNLKPGRPGLPASRGGTIEGFPAAPATEI